MGGAPDYYPRFWTYFLIGTLWYLYREQIRFDLRIALACAVAVGAIGATGHGLDALLPFALPYIFFSLAFSRRLRL